MQPKSKPTKVALAAIIITLVLIGFYTFVDKDESQSQTPSLKQSDQPQTMAKDPFKEYLENQQQGVVTQPSQALTSQTIQIGNSTSTTTVPVGTDPFKAFLEAQSKSKPEEAAISPFANRK